MLELSKVENAEWSKEDEWKRKELIQYLKEKGDYRTTWMTWLKFLPERFNLQPKQDWSEEDEDNLKAIIRIIEDNDSDWKELTDWLKSLRPQPHWKPSEEQMRALKEVLETYKGFEEYDAMKSLYNDLKKLM